MDSVLFGAGTCTGMMPMFQDVLGSNKDLFMEAVKAKVVAS